MYSGASRHRRDPIDAVQQPELASSWGLVGDEIRDGKSMRILDLLEKTWPRRFGSWWRYALSLTGNRADADEVVQEAVFKTLRAGPSLQDEGEAHAYVLTAVRNVALDHIGDRLRSKPIDEARPPEDLVGDSTLDAALDLEQRAAERRLFKELSKRLLKLPPELRQVLELRVMRETPLKFREIAEIQGISTSTAHYRLGRALRALAEGIEKIEGRTAEDDVE